MAPRTGANKIAPIVNWRHVHIFRIGKMAAPRKSPIGTNGVTLTKMAIRYRQVGLHSLREHRCAWRPTCRYG